MTSSCTQFGAAPAVQAAQAAGRRRWWWRLLLLLLSNSAEKARDEVAMHGVFICDHSHRLRLRASISSRCSVCSCSGESLDATSAGRARPTSLMVSKSRAYRAHSARKPLTKAGCAVRWSLNSFFTYASPSLRFAGDSFIRCTLFTRAAPRRALVSSTVQQWAATHVAEWCGRATAGSWLKGAVPLPSIQEPFRTFRAEVPNSRATDLRHGMESRVTSLGPGNVCCFKFGPGLHGPVDK